MQFEPASDLRDPVVLIAFSGWNDAGEAASDVMRLLLDAYPGSELEPVDDETYFDFQATRPHIRREADGAWIEWPSIRFRRLAHPERDIIVVFGPEPNLKWRSFCRTLVERVTALRPTIVLALGAMLSDIPHTRPLPTGLYAASEELKERFGFQRSTYTGPTGIVGVLSQAFAQHGLPTASLWVSVPHYVANPPNAKAQVHLLDKLEGALGISIDRGDLGEQARAWESAVNDLAQSDPEISQYIEALEAVRDKEVVEELSGDRIAAEFERYLRRHGGRS
ncbi:PAC2 family protein [Tessaracoccus sp. OH4464_COT-324]|uniref:PAC2 family protein n=1 Tax=Tessaracoccus sp. OH4464_COT-324 TaxID=2491059 RepID=UPI000F638BEA|nr:PAC2 family protein [Tessaracoccus sp. OH4464_COT-324]RRD47982.1 PAC2 family protein [Tessaracoccus sp. OH4464_COT-324]